MTEFKCLKAVFIFNFFKVIAFLMLLHTQKEMTPRKSEEDIMVKFCKS